MPPARSEVNLTDSTLGGASALVPDSPDDQSENFRIMLGLLGNGTNGATGVLPRGTYYVKKNVLARTDPNKNAITLRGDGPGATIIAMFPDVHYTGAALQDLLSTAAPWTYASLELQVASTSSTSAFATTTPAFVCSATSKLKFHYVTFSGFHAGSKLKVYIDAGAPAEYGVAGSGADIEIDLTAGVHTVKFELLDSAGTAGKAVSISTVRVTNARLTSDAFYVGHATAEPGEARLPLQNLLSPAAARSACAVDQAEREGVQ